MTEGTDFIRRWSRRKRAARQDPKVADAPADAPVVEDPEAGLAGDDISAAIDHDDGDDSPEPGPDDNPEVLDLPDIDSLSTDSDFKPFLKKGVPKELRNRAMRKLWRVNPAFGHLDGLNDYDGDFTDAATVVKGLKTLYKVGRGFMPDPDAEPKPDTVGNEPAADDQSAIAATDATHEPIDGGEEPGPDTEPDAEQEGNKIT